MPFADLVGNRAALDRLRGILDHRRLAHAYLFAGPDGVGKKTAALEFARALGASPTLVERPGDRREILIEQVREVIRQLTLTSDVPRAFVFDEADRMSEEGMNAVLKTLEEPPRRTTLVLVTANPQALLPTIRSRCQTVHFSALPEEEALRYAAETLGLDLEPARAVALLAGGSIGRMKELSEDVDDIVSTARDLQERVVTGELNPVIEALGKIRDTKKARHAARRGLMLLAHCLREVLRARSGASPSLASPAFVAKLSGTGEDDLLDRIETLLDHARLIDLNANVTLTVEDALLRI